jgi:hypothetical protein
VSAYTIACALHADGADSAHFISTRASNQSSNVFATTGLPNLLPADKLAEIISNVCQSFIAATPSSRT